MHILLSKHIFLYSSCSSLWFSILLYETCSFILDLAYCLLNSNMMLGSRDRSREYLRVQNFKIWRHQLVQPTMRWNDKNFPVLNNVCLKYLHYEIFDCALIKLSKSLSLSYCRHVIQTEFETKFLQLPCLRSIMVANKELKRLSFQ